MENITTGAYRRAKKIIPGRTQLLSKRPEMMAPEQWPAYFSRAHGCEIWDLDNRHYYDFSTNSVGACLLGYANQAVSSAVKRTIDEGTMSSLNPYEEVQLAEKLFSIHPWASAARFTRCGGESMAVAARIARATTDRSVIAISGYHGWHDWYLAANLGDNNALRGHLLPGLDPFGVPVELRGTAIPFMHSNIEEFDKVIAQYGDRLAAVIMEPCRHHIPAPGYLEHVKTKTKACGALLIFDEITIGWRLTLGGSHLNFGVNPDIAVFSKSLGNGHPIGAVIGTPSAMDGAAKSFISSTYWTDRVGPAAALATIAEMEKTNVSEHVNRIGKRIQTIWMEAIAEFQMPASVPDYFPCLSVLNFSGEKSNIIKTLFVQQMLEKGFLAGTAVYPTLAHNNELLNLYQTAVRQTFRELKSMCDTETPEKFLKGPEADKGFKRLVS